jgi:hypothetical protein
MLEEEGGEGEVGCRVTGAGRRGGAHLSCQQFSGRIRGTDDVQLCDLGWRSRDEKTTGGYAIAIYGKARRARKEVGG